MCDGNKILWINTKLIVILCFPSFFSYEKWGVSLCQTKTVRVPTVRVYLPRNFNFRTKWPGFTNCCVKLMCIGPCIIVIVEELETNMMSQFIKFYFTSSMLNMFQILIHPSSGACDFSVVSPHWLRVHIRRVLEFRCGWLCWYPCGRLQPATRIPTPTHVEYEHATNVAIQQKSRRLLTMDVLISETCWA